LSVLFPYTFMRAKIAAVEQALAFGFDEESVCIVAEWSTRYGVMVNSPMVNGCQGLMSWN
jgi:hypothetical protein